MLYDISFLSLCPKCNNYPLLTLNNLTEITIKCEHCGYNQMKTIHDYLSLMINRSSKKINNNKYCKAHFEQYNRYCEQCKLHLCRKCNTHQSHKLIFLDKASDTNKIFDKINEGYKHIKNYCNELKCNMIHHLLDKINQLEYSYRIFSSMNKDILDFMQLISNNYINNHLNYYLRCNYMSISSLNGINIYKCINENKKDVIINYYKKYKLIKEFDIDIQKFQNIKTIEDDSSQIAHLLLLSDGRLASCSFYSTINIYSINENNSYHCDYTIDTKHDDKVFYICQLDNGKLVSGSGDGVIKIWTISFNSYQCDLLLKKHMMVGYAK